jgi:hypothetical protein
MLSGTFIRQGTRTLARFGRRHRWLFAEKQISLNKTIVADFRHFCKREGRSGGPAQ